MLQAYAQAYDGYSSSSSKAIGKLHHIDLVGSLHIIDQVLAVTDLQTKILCTKAMPCKPSISNGQNYFMVPRLHHIDPVPAMANLYENYPNCAMPIFKHGNS